MADYSIKARLRPAMKREAACSSRKQEGMGHARWSLTKRD